MNQIKLYAMLLIAALTMSACDNEDDNTAAGYANRNANTNEKSQYATRLEVPQVKKGNNYLLLVKESKSIGVNYIVEWDCVSRAQRWVCFMWDNANSFKGWNRSNWSSGSTFNGYGGKGDPFQPDADIPAEYRTTLEDYSGSGYNRGHMCASEDRICNQEVNGQTFYLSNMHPQIGGHNSGVWSNMESKVRTWRDATVKNGGKMYVCKGGTIGDVTLNGKQESGVAAYVKNRVPVPKYFFMAILKQTASGLYTGMAFWTEHKSDNSSNLTPYMITINELEERTGYDFFCNLPDGIEEAVEDILTPSEWK